MEASSKYLDAQGPLFERFFKLGGPEGSSRINLKFGPDQIYIQSLNIIKLFYYISLVVGEH
jgi:hypothetical protein